MDAHEVSETAAPEAPDATSHAIGERFVRAVVAKDRDALLALFAPAVRMRGMAPGRSWEARDAVTLVDDILLGDFFGPQTEIEELRWSRFGAVVGTQRANYYLALRQGEQRLECEQHTFFDVEDELVTAIYLSCSGFTPVPR